MTERDWVGCRDPRAMLTFLGTQASERKLHLLAGGCCRLVWRLLPDAGRRAVELAERLADQEVEDRELFTTVRAAIEAACDVSDPAANLAAERAYRSASRDAWYAAAVVGYGPDAAEEAAVVRDIFGNPFRAVAFDPSWRSSTVTALARVIHDERKFDAMPLLADALEEAGCDSAELLSHLRGPGPHVRGCWALDWALGKE